jgi:hypothetical protein
MSTDELRDDDSEPAEHRMVLLPSDPLDAYLISGVRPRNWKMTFVRAHVALLDRFMSSLRRTHAGGRPAKPRPCPRCGVQRPSARAAREHC